MLRRSQRNERNAFSNHQDIAYGDTGPLQCVKHENNGTAAHIQPVKNDVLKLPPRSMNKYLVSAQFKILIYPHLHEALTVKG